MYSSKEAKVLLENLVLLEDFEWNLFLHRICDHLCARLKLVDLYALYPRQIRDHPFSKYVSICITLIRSVLKCEVEAETVVAGLDKTFQQVLTERRTEVLQALKEENVFGGEARLSDFDWAVRLILGSDTMSSIMKPICQLQLQVDHPCPCTGTREPAQISCIELSTDELDSLIGSLENALTAYEKFN
uniref:COMM domain-containing protein n=1 Tax=Aplanochytrium stocchinoi TaxID=215587 RepID=A0A6S8BJA7_9STRA|mmetsp:Transcript_4847/g.5671  ORF Transcript_4847/g.5671 Transcript_4847/m.5671 type:complete len:188 (-) Transcript_4847:462-1025(-)|eukprot:CAMPEP_0204830524 /NCGR_PEP_ID=MMETSP1346-20131115/8762_1 /ASSEMBLY_ACC=CAM_ASM_000771 /TAXON_ID=215587 /ORGANISM="Aplanochytrium stocchinoi, Strain GSBS06" /LENGTH=187 /DNA_ID=CAMNT_0051960847 /DNA_START=140 /DNA_END=703 /DNA_ORIENTATION=+